jgi:PST family polysaccharide transporter
MSKAEPTQRQSLDHALVKGVAWTGAATWVAQALTWISTLVVVRLLTPDDYGLVALAGVYLGLITVLSEFGIGTAVITLRDLTRRQVAELNTIAMGFALVALVFSLLAAGVVATFFASPRLVEVIWVMSLMLILGAIASVSNARLQKELHFRFLAQAQIIQALTSALATLLLALVGSGYWALALGPAAGQLVFTAMVATRMPTGYAWPTAASLGPVMKFSRQVITERMAWYGYTSSDKLVIGRWIGEVSTGLYAVASTFGMLAVEKVTVLMLRVAPAVFSAVQHDAAALRRYLLTMTEAVAVVTFPISIGMALVAEDLVPLMLGPQWVEAIAPLQLLAIYGAFQSVSPLLNRVLAVIGETRFNMNVALVTLFLLPFAFMGATRWGLTGVAAAWLLVPIIQFPIYLRLRQRIGLSLLGYLRALWPAVSSVGVMAGAVLLLHAWPQFDEFSPRLSLALTAGVGALVYCGMILLVHSGRVRTFRAMVSEMRMHRDTPAVA